MESIVRNIREIDVADRQALEHVIGQRLGDDQQLIIQVTTVSEQAAAVGAPPAAGGGLPTWCNVYEGLSDDQIDQIESAILDRDHWNRPIA